MLIQIEKIKYITFKNKIKKMLEAEFSLEGDIENSNLIFDMSKEKCFGESWKDKKKELILYDTNLRYFFETLLNFNFKMNDGLMEYKNGTSYYLFPVKIKNVSKKMELCYSINTVDNSIIIEEERYFYKTTSLDEKKNIFLLCYLLFFRLNKNFKRKKNELLLKRLYQLKDNTERIISESIFEEMFDNIIFLEVRGESTRKIKYISRAILDSLLLKHKTYIECIEFSHYKEKITNHFSYSKKRTDSHIMDTEVRDYYLRALESEETDLKFLLYYKILTFFYEKSKKNIEEKINKLIKESEDILFSVKELAILENLLVNFFNYEKFLEINEGKYRKWCQRKISFVKQAPVISWNSDKKEDILRKMAKRFYKIKSSINYVEKGRETYNKYKKNHISELTEEVKVIKSIVEIVLISEYNIIEA